MSTSHQHVLICYGGKSGYYHGAKYQILKSYKWMRGYPIQVVTDRPDLFYNYPVNTLSLDDEKITRWSLNGQDHFGIKLLGLLWAIQSGNEHTSKSILLDTDMFLTKDPSVVINSIDDDNIAMFRNEGKVIGSKNSSIKQYSEGLKNKKLKCESFIYELSEESIMWGSAIIGISHSNKYILSQAFDLFCQLSPNVKAHTAEQFALSETIRFRHRKNIFSAKHLVDNWSSTGKKEYATPVIEAFFAKYGGHDFDSQLRHVHEIRINRPFSTLLKQKIKKWNKK